MAKAKKEEVKEEKKDVKNSSNDELQKVKDELALKNDQLLRLAAEYDNFRKRSQREKEGIYSDVKANVLGDFLPITDNFKRALENTSGTVEDCLKGIEMISNQFNEALKKHGVEEFGEVGEEFDPNIHNAVMHIDDEELGENVIADVFNKGYKVGDKIIRHAVVKVAN